mmetsp:Transcript_25211/g.35212  ORF Transcript_25211/g.35212 Transcript_25211/m.35212 type:complete len:265 (+) Transcript_25211:11-805(+)
MFVFMYMCTHSKPWKLAWISDSYHIDWKKLLLSRLTKAYERDLKTARREELLAAGMDIADSDDDSLSLEIEELKVEEKEEEVTDRGQSPLATDYLTASSSRNDGEAVVFDTEATSFSSNTLENNVYDADEVLTMDTEDANNDDVTEMIRRSKWKGLSCYDKQQTASVAAIGCRTQVRASLYTMTSLLPQIFRFLKGDELAQFGVALESGRIYKLRNHTWRDFFRRDINSGARFRSRRRKNRKRQEVNTAYAYEIQLMETIFTKF